jgi:hypothetical protein
MSDHGDKVAANWQKFLNPKQLRTNLQLASLFLAAWELLRGAIVTDTKEFFCLSYCNGKWVPEPEYKAEVLARDNDLLTASCLWLKHMGAIGDDDLHKIKTIRKHRNELAHELPEFLSSVDREIDVKLFADMYALLSKVDHWWFVNLHAAMDPDLRDKDIDEQRIESGRMISLWIIIQVVSGNEARIARLSESLEEKPHDDMKEPPQSDE